MSAEEHEDSAYSHKEPCPNCGSKDNLARYDDGHAYCFGCEYREPATGETTPSKPQSKSLSKPKDFMPVPFGEYGAIPSRKITEETCKKFKYYRSVYLGSKCHAINVPDRDGNPVAQKIRMPNKEFRFPGDTKKAALIGMDIWQPGGKKLVITEGEMDMLSVSQLQGNKWPVCSIPNGAKGAVKAFKNALEWVCSFEEVILMFDMDEDGQDAAIECAQLLPIGKAKIASLPLKDANECLKQGRGAEVIDAIWKAKEYRPDGIVSFGDLKEKVLKPVEWGKPWIFETLTLATYGRREGEVYFIGAGTGVGKTDFMTQQASEDIKDGEKVALFFMEQPNVETAKRLAGKIAGKRFHVPDAGWTPEDLNEAFDKLDNNSCFLYDHFGSSEWNTIASHIRFLALREGVKHFYIDHLTAFASHAQDERKELERITAEMAGIAQELSIYLYVVSHLATPEGKPHEEGGRVMIRHFKGSRAIGFWAHFMFALERNTQADDEEERQVTTFRILKDRYTGQATGKTFYLGYQREGGILYEREWAPKEESVGSSFSRAASGPVGDINDEF